MGSPMAGYLSKKNNVSIYNRTKGKCDNWIKNYNIYKSIIENEETRHIEVFH